MRRIVAPFLEPVPGMSIPVRRCVTGLGESLDQWIELLDRESGITYALPSMPGRAIVGDRRTAHLAQAGTPIPVPGSDPMEVYATTAAWACSELDLNRDRLTNRAGPIALSRIVARRLVAEGHTRGSRSAWPSTVASLVAITPRVQSTAAAAALGTCGFDEDLVELCVASLHLLSEEEEALVALAGGDLGTARMDALADTWFDRHGTEHLGPILTMRPRTRAGTPTTLPPLAGRLVHNGCHPDRALEAVRGLADGTGVDALPERLRERYGGPVVPTVEYVGLDHGGVPPATRFGEADLSSYPGLTIAWEVVGEVRSPDRAEVWIDPLTRAVSLGKRDGDPVPNEITALAEGLGTLLTVVPDLGPDRLWFALAGTRSLGPFRNWLSVLIEAISARVGPSRDRPAPGHVVAACVAGRLPRPGGLLDYLSLRDPHRAIALDLAHQMASSVRVFDNPWSTLVEATGRFGGPKYLLESADLARWADQRGRRRNPGSYTERLSGRP